MGLSRICMEACRRKRLIDGNIHSHEHVFQIIVSEEELLYQLQEAYQNENLLYCLALGEKDPHYSRRLLLAGLKYQFIGSLFYPAGCMGADTSKKVQKGKLPIETYKRRLFDDFMESADEAGYWLDEHHIRSVDPNNLLRKYSAVWEYCSRMLTGLDETYFADEYREIIEYIGSSKSVPPAVFEDSNFPELPFKLMSDIDYGNIYD